MRVWRLARRAYPALDGKGAQRTGGRWNSPGHPAVYTASRLSLAALELLVHLDPDTIPDDLTAFEIEVPESVAVEALNLDLLPPDWRSLPDHPACRSAGDEWLSSQRTAVLAVPSAIVPAELNYLINPRHRDSKSIKAIGFERFSLDPRLLRPGRSRR